MRKTHSKVLFLAMLILILALAACGKDEGGSSKDTSNGANEDNLYSIDDFSATKTNKGEPIDGGSITFGLVSDSAFKGTLNWNFYSGDPDYQIIRWFDESLLDMDENYKYVQTGAATYEVSDDKRTFTFKIRDGVNWQDGEPVTAGDWAFAYEVIGHPDYDGVRYDSTFKNIEGMEAYHNGKADSISGIEVVDDKTLKVTYIDASPSLLYGGIWPYALPKHIFKDIPVAKMSSSPEVREHPIGFGPFKVESIVPGESVILTANEDYWRGEPNLDKVTIKVINPNTVVQSLENGDVDLVSSFPTDQYPNNADMSNVEFLGKVDMAYTYIGFKLGTWDKEKGEVKPNPNAKMANVNLRKAMWRAVDNETVGKKFYHGLRWNATTLIPPSHPMYHDNSNPGLTYDPEKAKQLLDDAGYKDLDGDGFREDPNGDQLVINFASMAGGDTAEPLAKYYMQAWKNVGLNVQLIDGRLLEFESFYDRVGNGGNDDPEIDIFQGAWGVGSDVDPAGLYGRDAMFNFSRYASEKNDELLAAGVSEKAFDTEKRKEIYNEWQQLMVEDVPVFPTLYRSVLIPVNNRVVNYSIADDSKIYLYQIGVTQEEPIKAEE